MSMINCSECKNLISDAAEVCPHCGVKSRKKQGEDQKDNLSGAITAIGIAIILLGLVLMMSGI